MCLQRLRRVRNNARLFHLIGNGIGTVRLIVSSHQFQKFVQTVFHVFNLGTKLVCHNLREKSRAAFLIGRSVHQAQLSVSIETVVSNFPHDFTCSFLCEHREEVQQCCRLLFVWWSRHHHCWWLSRCFQQGRIGRIERTCVSVECEIQSSKSLPGAYGSGFPTLMSSGRHLDFLSRCHRHSISQYCNTRNRSISQFQEYLLRYHASVEDDTKRVQSALCTRMKIIFYAIRLGPKTSVCRDECQCQVYCDKLWCDLPCNYITQVQQAKFEVGIFLKFKVWFFFWKKISSFFLKFLKVSSFLKCKLKNN